FVSPGEHRLTCPQTLEAVEGEDVTLRCRLHPPLNLSGYAFDVARESDDHGKYDDVYAYRNGKVQPEDQADRYKNRTHLNHEALGGGDVVLTIFSVNRSDSGTYTVFIKKLGARSVVNITVVPKGQRSKTKRNDPTTTRPPATDPGKCLSCCLYFP
ncbi:butyrophilin subfamily 1 member A1, partial [Etheostoma spectabile]|uniref:butyrophilin subfamily 1 member A1 n=1 Tax=Etheostoma spectabile TaxID=54343 RepID=UPI0013AEC457